MSRPLVTMIAAIVAALAIAYLFYRLARELGFLEPPTDKQHEYRRTIIVAIYAMLLFLPVLFYGFEKRWPRAWVLFGIATGLAFAVMGGIALWSVIALWRLRHPK